MESCCVEVLATMQNRIEASKWLKILLVASPFVLLLEHAPEEQAAELLKDMAVETAVEKITKGGKLPEVADAVKSVDVILRNRLNQDATLHYLDHQGTVARFWERLAALYA
jgi:hypothetical protein